MDSDCMYLERLVSIDRCRLGPNFSALGLIPCVNVSHIRTGLNICSRRNENVLFNLPRVVASSSVLHFDLERLVKVLCAESQEFFPEATERRIARQVQVEEAMNTASLEQTLAFGTIVSSEEVQVERWQSGRENVLFVRDSHGFGT